MRNQSNEDELLPLVVRPKTACRMLSCGHSQLYELLNAGELESYLEGAARKITTASIHAYHERKLAAAQAKRAEG
jgi:excisionase family DNA binding protein